MRYGWVAKYMCMVYIKQGWAQENSGSNPYSYSVGTVFFSGNQSLKCISKYNRIVYDYTNAICVFYTYFMKLKTAPPYG